MPKGISAQNIEFNYLTRSRAGILVVSADNSGTSYLGSAHNLFTSLGEDFHKAGLTPPSQKELVAVSLALVDEEYKEEKSQSLQETYKKVRPLLEGGLDLAAKLYSPRPQ